MFPIFRVFRKLNYQTRVSQTMDLIQVMDRCKQYKLVINIKRLNNFFCQCLRPKICFVGMLTVAYPVEGATETKDWSSPLINTGYAFSFSVSVKAQGLNASGSAYSINASVTGALRPSVALVPFGRKWNYGNVTIKVGGNGPLDPIGATFFRGCLSDVTFKGVDIVKEYFKQYPNNTNPKRGKQMFIRDGHSFSNVSQICDDVMSTAKPTSTDASKPKTTVTSASANLSSTKATSVPQTTKAPKTTPKNDASILTVTAITICLSISFECLVTWLQHLT